VKAQGDIELIVAENVKIMGSGLEVPHKNVALQDLTLGGALTCQFSVD